MNGPKPDRALAGRALAAVALLMLTSATAIADTTTDLHIPAGEVWDTDAPLVAGTITVAGTLNRSTPGDLVLQADTIRILDGAVLRGIDGTPGEHALALTALAQDGTDGGGIILQARRVEIAPGATLQAGSGAAGGNALGDVFAHAGDGGRGGDIRVLADEWVLDGVLLPGAGGDGGHAVAGVGGLLLGQAFGGTGGDAGAAFLNEAPWAVARKGVQAPEISQAAAISLEALCASVEKVLDEGLLQPTARSSLDCRVPRDVRVMEYVYTFAKRVCASPITDAICDTPDPEPLKRHVTSYVVKLLAKCRFTFSDLYRDPTVCGIEDPGALDLVRTGFVLVNNVVQDCGVDSGLAFQTYEKDAPLVVKKLGYSCEEILGYAVSDVVDVLTHPPMPGMPGTPKADSGCLKPQGDPGEPNAMGNGGDGGDACVDNSGGGGSRGAPGRSGFFSCTAGGPGGPGGPGAEANAIGGPGGAGAINGGNGGSATAIAKGGDGGDGGNGGVQVFGADCAGGAGGNAGDAADSKAIGGAGGIGACGTGGAGGNAVADSDAGDAGEGGKGNPSGLPGGPGVAAAGLGIPGPGGVGAGLCPMSIISPGVM